MPSIQTDVRPVVARPPRVPRPSPRWRAAPPEAAAGGPLAFVRDGDIISYSVKDRTLNLTGIKGEERTPKEIEKMLEERKKEGIIPRPKRKGILARYTRDALSAMEGAGYEE